MIKNVADQIDKTTFRVRSAQKAMLSARFLFMFTRHGCKLITAVSLAAHGRAS